MAAEIDANIGEHSVPRADFIYENFPGAHQKYQIPVGDSLDLRVFPYNNLISRKSIPLKPFVIAFAFDNRRSNGIRSPRTIKVFPMSAILQLASGKKLMPLGFRLSEGVEQRARCSDGAVRDLTNTNYLTDLSGIDIELRGRSSCIEVYYDIDTIAPDAFFSWTTPMGVENNTSLFVHEVTFEKQYGRWAKIPN